MTRDETKIIIRAMSASYPNFNPKDLSGTVDIWSQMLIEYDYKDISKALQKYILSDSSGFAPSIGQIVGLIDMPISREPLEAWSLVRKAICNGTYHSEEEFAKLPAEIQTAIGSAANLKEMAQMDVDVVESVEQSHFIRSYQTVLKRLDEERRLPNQFKSYTQQIAEKIQEHKAIEVKEEVTEEPVKVDDNRESLTEMVKQRMEKRKREREIGSQDKWRDIHTEDEGDTKRQASI